MSFFLSIAVVLLLLGDSQPLFPQAPVFSPPGIHDPEGAAAQPWIGPPRAAGPGEEGGKHAGSNRVSAAPQCACLLICYLGEVSRFGQVDFVPSSAPQGVSTPAAPDSQPALSPGVGADLLRGTFAPGTLAAVPRRTGGMRLGEGRAVRGYRGSCSGFDPARRRCAIPACGGRARPLTPHPSPLSPRPPRPVPSHRSPSHARAASRGDPAWPSRL